MDLIAIIAALLLNASTGCDAMKADVMRVGGQDYLVQAWTCGDKSGKSHIWRTWQRECVANNGTRYFGRPYFLEDTTSHLGIYVNRFSEIQGGFGAAIENAYVGLCGS
jgi:hypothetical protein